MPEQKRTYTHRKREREPTKIYQEMEKKKKRRGTTERRYRSIERAVHLRLGTMPVMMVYASVAKEMGIAEETVRRVMWEMRRGG
jgi:hypothetical protein